MKTTEWFYVWILVGGAYVEGVGRTSPKLAYLAGLRLLRNYAGYANVSIVGSNDLELA